LKGKGAVKVLVVAAIVVRGRGAGERRPGKVSQAGNCFAVKLKIFG
jgi:hypothetical protein